MHFCIGFILIWVLFWVLLLFFVLILSYTTIFFFNLISIQIIIKKNKFMIIIDDVYSHDYINIILIA